MTHSLNLSTLPSPFYRVTAKALIFDTAERLLVAINKAGRYEIPGGGWEYGESFADCIRREIYEELGISVTSVGPIIGSWQHVHYRHGYHMIRFAAFVSIGTDRISPNDPMAGYAWLGADSFTEKDWEYEGDPAEMQKLIWGKNIRSHNDTQTKS